MNKASASRPKRRKWRTVDIVFLSLVPLPLIYFIWIYGPTYQAYWNYTPQEGDVVFQALPHNRLVDAIEGVTDSPYSHCGIVGKDNDKWVVFEALGKVRATPLKEFLFRGRNQGFAVYRLKDPYKKFVPDTIKNTRDLLGLPYDVRYRMDDEYIYCSELVFKAFRKAANQNLGRLVSLRSLNWEPYEETIVHFEGGPTPLDRKMITPKDLAKADQLEPLVQHRLRFERQ